MSSIEETMKTTHLIIEETEPSSVAQLLHKSLKDSSTWATADGTRIIAVEAFYFRVKSNLLSVIILSRTATGGCAVEIITGGGATGILGITWGAESDCEKQLTGVLNRICTTQSWAIRTVPSKERIATI